jgi:hypothetical protein
MKERGESREAREEKGILSLEYVLLLYNPVIMSLSQ